MVFAFPKPFCTSLRYGYHVNIYW